MEDVQYAEKINDLNEVKDIIDTGFSILNRDLEELKNTSNNIVIL